MIDWIVLLHLPFILVPMGCYYAHITSESRAVQDTARAVALLFCVVNICLAIITMSV